MAQTTSLVFNGGVIPSPSPVPAGSGKAKLLKIGEITIVEQGVQVTKKVICDPDSVTTVAPFMEVLTSARLAELISANSILVLDDGTVQYLMADATVVVEDGTSVCTSVNFLGLSLEDRAKVLYPCTRVTDELTLQQVLEVGEPVETGFDLVKAYPEDTEAGTLIDKLMVEDTVQDPEDQPLLQILPSEDGEGHPKVAINEDNLREAILGINNSIDGIIDTLDEMDFDSVPHAYLGSTLFQSAGDSVTTGTPINVFSCTSPLVGDCFEFEQTTTIDDTPFGYVWIEPGTYLINAAVTLQWVGNPRGTFVAKVGSVMGENFDFSQEQEIKRNTTKVVTIPNRMKLSVNITYDAGTPVMGFWIQSMQVVKLAGGMSQTNIVHDNTLVGRGSIADPLGVDEENVAQSTLAGNVAPAFVPNDTNTVADMPYVYNGSLYIAKEAYRGAWDASKFDSVSVSELIEYVKSFFDKPAITYEDGYFVNYKDGSVSSSVPISASNAINVRFATKIELVAWGDSYAPDLRGCAFYDASGNFISGMQYAINKNAVSVEVPSNAVYFRFSTLTTKKDETYFRVVDVFGCLKRVADLAANDVAGKCLAYRPSLSWIDDYFVNGYNGKLVSYDGIFSVSKITVRGFKSLTFLADHTTSASDARGYAFYDEDGNVVSYGAYSVGSGTYRIDDIPVPTSASSFAFTGSTARKASYYVELHGTNDAVVKLIELSATKESVSKVENALLSKNPSLSWIDNYFVNGSNGTFVSYNNASVSKMNVRGFVSISFLADKVPSGDVRGYAFYDADFKMVSCAGYSSGSGRYVESVSVPPSATYFCFTAMKAYKSSYYVELHGTNDAVMAVSEDVAKLQKGSTYIPFSMFENFAVCGDSFSAGSIFDSEGTYRGDFQKVCWGKVLERLTGVTSYNYSSGGATTKTFRTREACLPKILNDPARDLYILALGINDYGSLNVGSISDINDENPELNADTFCGNYGYIIAKILEHAPNAKIILLKSWLPKYATSNPYGKSGYYSYCSSAIEALAEHYGILYVETLYIPFLCSSEYNTGFFGGHPTAPLYAGMAYAMRKAIGDVLTDNIDYLNDYRPT